MTNPSTEQIEAAAEAMISQNSDYCTIPPTDAERDWYRRDARAALVAAAGVTPQEPERVEEALRFCTCSHWLEAHQERECMEFACACKKFSPVVQVDEAKLAEVVRRVDSHEWSRMGGSQGEQVAGIVRDVLRGGQ